MLTDNSNTAQPHKIGNFEKGFITKPDDGGFAFPISLPGWGDNGACGMSLRDYFAAKAMEAQIIHYGYSDGSFVLAKQSYEVADAMLKENLK